MRNTNKTIITHHYLSCLPEQLVRSSDQLVLMDTKRVLLGPGIIIGYEIHTWGIYWYSFVPKPDRSDWRSQWLWCTCGRSMQKVSHVWRHKRAPACSGCNTSMEIVIDNRSWQISMITTVDCRKFTTTRGADST